MAELPAAVYGKIGIVTCDRFYSRAVVNLKYFTKVIDSDSFFTVCSPEEMFPYISQFPIYPMTASFE